MDGNKIPMTYKYAFRNIFATSVIHFYPAISEKKEKNANNDWKAKVRVKIVTIFLYLYFF